MYSRFLSGSGSVLRHALDAVHVVLSASGELPAPLRAMLFQGQPDPSQDSNILGITVSAFCPKIGVGLVLGDAAPRGPDGVPRFGWVLPCLLVFEGIILNALPNVVDLSCLCTLTFHYLHHCRCSKLIAVFMLFIFIMAVLCLCLLLPPKNKFVNLQLRGGAAAGCEFQAQRFRYIKAIVYVICWTHIFFPPSFTFPQIFSQAMQGQ